MWYFFMKSGDHDLEGGGGGELKCGGPRAVSACTYEVLKGGAYKRSYIWG